MVLQWSQYIWWVVVSSMCSICKCTCGHQSNHLTKVKRTRVVKGDSFNGCGRRCPFNCRSRGMRKAERLLGQWQLVIAETLPKTRDLPALAVWPQASCWASVSYSSKGWGWMGCSFLDHPGCNTLDPRRNSKFFNLLTYFTKHVQGHFLKSWVLFHRGNISSFFFFFPPREQMGPLNLETHTVFSPHCWKFGIGLWCKPLLI